MLKWKMLMFICIKSILSHPIAFVHLNTVQRERERHAQGIEWFIP